MSLRPYPAVCYIYDSHSWMWKIQPLCTQTERPVTFRFG